MGTGASSDPSLTSGQAESSCGWRSWTGRLAVVWASAVLGLPRCAAQTTPGAHQLPLLQLFFLLGPRCQCQEEGEHTLRGDGVSIDKTLRASAPAT